MTTLLLEPPTVADDQGRHSSAALPTNWFDHVLDVSADQLSTYGHRPGARVAERIDHFREEREDFAVWIVLIVAIAVVAVVGIMAYVAVICINRGGSYAGGLSIKTNGWKVWQYKLQFKCTR